MAAKLNFSRSRLVREALEQYVEAQRRQELRDLLKEGYAVNAERDLRICEEFTTTDYEIVARHVPPYGGSRYRWLAASLLGVAQPDQGD